MYIIMDTKLQYFVNLNLITVFECPCSSNFSYFSNIISELITLEWPSYYYRSLITGVDVSRKLIKIIYSKNANRII